MNKKYAIFDMDGTLIDSMTYWKNLGREYLSMQGVPENLDAVMEEIKPLTMTESAELFRTRFSLSGTKESIAASMNWMIEEHYRKDIPLKTGSEGLSCKTPCIWCEDVCCLCNRQSIDGDLPGTAGDKRVF